MKTIIAKIHNILPLNCTTSSVITLLQAVILSFFLAMQFCPDLRCKFYVLTFLPNICQNVAGIFLQIEATLLTLTIAIVAIVSGLISCSYMGINYTDFVLNRRPVGYSQRLVIKLSLGYIAFAGLCLWAGKYYLVAGSFFCELLLIYMSAISIFDIFKGNQYLNDKIKVYSMAAQLGQPQSCQGGKGKQEHSYEEDSDVIKKNTTAGNVQEGQDATARNIQDKFIEAFGYVLTQGSETEYEEYVGTFLEITKEVWQKRNEDVTYYSLEQYQKNVNKLIHVCIKSKETFPKLMALHLIDNIYETLSNCIKESVAKCGTWQRMENDYVDVLNGYAGADGAAYQLKLHRSFQLISTYEYKVLLRKININDLEEKVSVQRTLSNMNFVDMVLFYEQRQEKETWGSTETVLSIQAYLGQYIAERKQNGSNPSIGYWSRAFWNSFLKPVHESVVEKADLPVYYKALGNAGIMYTCGLLASGCFDIVREGLYKEILTYPTFCNSVINRIVAAVHPYLYYMTTREETDCIGGGLQEQAKKFWDANAEIYTNFIRNNGDITQLWIENLNTEYRLIYAGQNEQRKRDEKSSWIYMLLNSFDFKIYSDKGGIFILPEAIRDFCLFSILDESFRVRFDWLKDDYHKVEDFTSYVQSAHVVEVKQTIDDYVRFRMGATLKRDREEKDKDINDVASDVVKSGKEENEKIAAKAQEIYKRLVIGIKGLFREKKANEAREWQADYLKNWVAIEDGKDHWKKELIKTLQETFGENLCFNDDGKRKYYDIKLPKFEVYTNEVRSAFNENNMASVVACLIDDYIWLLKKQGCLVGQVRTDFKDDQDYIHYLQSNQLTWLVGSEFLLMNQDYQTSEKFREATKDYKWVKSIGCRYAMAVRKESVRFYIKEIVVTIRTAGIKDIDVENDNADFAYEPIKDVKLTYKDRRELEEFIGQEKKVIEVTAKIAVAVYDEQPVGIYFANF